jgi:hypothetical protein
VKYQGDLLMSTDMISNYNDDVLVVSQTVPVLPPPAPVPPPKGLDLVFVIDATGSMRVAIRAVHKYAMDIALTFRTNRNLDLRMACVCYRDPVDDAADEHEVHEFNPSVRELKQFLKGIQAKGGGDDPEDFVGAITRILALNWRPNANHGVVWIADANAHGRRYCSVANHQEEEGKLEPLVKEMANLEMRFHGFSLRDGATRTFEEMREIYRAANPQLFFTFKPYSPDRASIEVEAKTMGAAISETLRVCRHEFTDDGSPLSRIFRQPDHKGSTDGIAGRRLPVDSFRDGRPIPHRSVTFALL